MNSVRQFKSGSDEETRNIGRQLASELPKKGLVLLIGDLGAGKTTLTKGIAEGLGAASADDVSSPTFTLIHEYGDPPRMYHIDLYRLDTEEQVTGLGLDELLDRPALVLIEWAERFPGLWPDGRVEIQLIHTSGDMRLISVRYPEAV